MRLIDDDSERVQRAVAEALAAFGESLEERLGELTEPPTEEQLQQVRDLLHRYHGHEVPSARRHCSARGNSCNTGNTATVEWSLPMT
mgnify:CR=1 FL=1